MIKLSKMKTVLFIAICIVLTSETDGHRVRRFVGGKTASVEQFPYHVSLRYVKNDEHFCGGSIIHEQFVLTAAHCLYEEYHEDFYVAAGTNLVSSWRKRSWVERFSMHADYDVNTLINDIALIRLKKPFTFSKYIQKIPLPAFASEPPTYVSMTASGFGRFSYHLIDNSATLQYSNVTSISLLECRKTTEQILKLYYITNNHICTFDPYKGLCHGDSGGPLVYQGELVGIMSWIMGKCTNIYPDIYVKVAPYVKWIEQTKDKLILESKFLDEPKTKLATTTEFAESTTELAEFITHLDEYTTELSESTTKLTRTIDLVESTTELAESTTELVESRNKLNKFTLTIADSKTNLTESTTELTESTTELTESMTELIELTTELTESSNELVVTTPVDEFNKFMFTTGMADSKTNLTESTTELTESTTELTESMAELIEFTTELIESSNEIVVTTPVDEFNKFMFTTEIADSKTNLNESTTELTESTTELTESLTELTEFITELTESSKELVITTPR